MSDLVHETVRILLADDAEDLADLEARRREPAVSFEDSVLRLSGRLLCGS